MPHALNSGVLSPWLQRMNILWHYRPHYDAPRTSGINLRVFDFTRELAALGHRVYYLIDNCPAPDDCYRDAFLAAIRKDRSLAGIFELNYEYPSLRGAIAHKLIYPPAVNLLLSDARSRTSRAISALIRRHNIDIFLSKARGSLWLLHSLQRDVVTAIDWCDSEALACLRELKFRFRHRKLSGTPGLLKSLARALVQESYDGRRADVSVAASFADKAMIDFLARRPERTHVIPNGVKMGSPGKKNCRRIIFSGTLDFPPNYHSAMWFIDRVLPLIRAGRPDVELVVAGSNPVPELRARASAYIKIPGFVEDLAAAIGSSQLAVAPMVCGSGFKTKVAESIANGTFVVGTSLAFEFLNPEVRDLLLTGDTPETLAGQILHYLRDPEAFQNRLEQARRLVAETLEWSAQARKLADLFAAALAKRRCRNPPMRSATA